MTFPEQKTDQFTPPKSAHIMRIAVGGDEAVPTPIWPLQYVGNRAPFFAISVTSKSVGPASAVAAPRRYDPR